MHQDKESTQTKRPERKKRTPKKITPTYLHNAGLYYLGRYSASSGHFRKTMMRKITKSCMAHPDQDREACIAMLDNVVTTFCDSGLLNDTAYVTGKISTWHRQGRSARYIAAKLAEKSVASDVIAEHLAPLQTDDHEREAAAVFARKKRVFQKDLGDPDIRRKVMGMFARAGFSYGITQHALNRSDT